MKVFNISDRQDEVTDRLAFHGQQSIAFSVGGKVITPGSSEEVKEHFRHEVEPFLRSGAACLEKVPEGYAPQSKKDKDKKQGKDKSKASQVAEAPAARDSAPTEEQKKDKEGGQKFGR
jgi:hypothetical protein